MLPMAKDIFKNPTSATKSILNEDIVSQERVIQKLKLCGKLNFKTVKSNKVEDDKLYICKYCCYNCSSLSFLRYHISNHGENPKHACYLCGHSSNTFSSLMVHFCKHSNCHNSSKSVVNVLKVSSNISNDAVSSKECLKCKVCNASFESFDQLQSHDCLLLCNEKPISTIQFVSNSMNKMKHTHELPNTGRLDCSSVTLQLSKREKQSEDIAGCLENGKHSKKECAKTFEMLQATRKSMRLGKKKRRVFSETTSKRIENFPHENDQCFHSFKIDAMKCDKEELFCYLCSLSFTSKKNLHRHQQMHTEKPSFMCRFCGKFFHRKDIHNRHEKSVHEANTFRICCYYCKSYFISISSLKEHVISVHSECEIQPRFKIPSYYPKRKKSAGQNSNVQCTKVSSKAYLKKYRNIEQKINGSVTTTDRKSDETSSLCIKEEISTDHNRSNGISMNYKCGKCLEPYNSLQHLLKHFQSVHDVSFESPSSPNQVENLQYQPDNFEINQPVVKNFDSISSSNMQLESHLNTHPNYLTIPNGENYTNIVSCDGIEHTVSNDSASSSDIGNGSNCDDLLNSVAKHVFPKVSQEDQEAMETSSFGKSIENVLMSPFNKTCSLCLQHFSCQSAFISHENQHMHKVVHWYRCAICDACGPKKSMAQHMLSHMQEVGSFVVNGNEQNFENILPYLPPNTKIMMNDNKEIVPAIETGIS